MGSVYFGQRNGVPDKLARQAEDDPCPITNRIWHCEI